jgi:hypothetical protein
MNRFLVLVTSLLFGAVLWLAPRVAFAEPSATQFVKDKPAESR